jgi:methylenetetrahydrofolate dehydrogenase (NADP+)/methenyltetrahydrofolate cyclohydrolase
MQIIDGRKIRDNILENIKKEVELLSFVPVFCDVLVGEDKVSEQYVRMKDKTATSVGIKFHNAHFPATITTEELIEEIKVLNNIPNMCGLIVQLPLPENIDTKKVLDAIDPDLDVDCLGSLASEKFYQNISHLAPPTANACVYILKSLNISLENKKIVVLGNGELVGRPVSALLKSLNFEVDTITRNKENKEIILKNADVVISGMGNGKYINSLMIKENAIIVDAGTSESGSGIVGDVDIESIKDMQGFISPVPGGVGPVTIAMLLQNVLTVAKNKNN